MFDRLKPMTRYAAVLVLLNWCAAMLLPIAGARALDAWQPSSCRRNGSSSRRGSSSKDVTALGRNGTRRRIGITSSGCWSGSDKNMRGFRRNSSNCSFSNSSNISFSNSSRQYAPAKPEPMRDELQHVPSLDYESA